MYTSYVLQCCIILLIYAAFFVFSLLRHSDLKALSPYRASFTRQRDLLVTGLIEFQKAQCLFSTTVQIASIAAGIYTTNLLTVFSLVPLATNGIVPIVFGHLLVLRYGRSSVYLTSLACISWFFSTLVYWSLFRHLVSANLVENKYLVYENIMYKLSSNEACGGFSALAVCPSNLIAGQNRVFSSGEEILFITPILWTTSTAILFVLIGLQLFRWLRRRLNSKKANYMAKVAEQNRNSIESPFFRELLSTQGIFWIVSSGFVVAMGVQLSLLYVEVALQMIDYGDWSFGQIIAVTVWIPPLLEYVYLQLRKPSNYSDRDFSNKMYRGRGKGRRTSTGKKDNNGQGARHF